MCSMRDTSSSIASVIWPCGVDAGGITFLQAGNDRTPIARMPRWRLVIDRLGGEDSNRLCRDERRLRRHARVALHKSVPALKSVFPRDEKTCVVEGDVVVLIGGACLSAEVELHVGPHRLLVPAVPGERPVTFHRRGRARAIRLEQRFGHVLELSQRPCGLFGVRGQLVLEFRPAGESVLQCQRVLHVSQGRLRERVGNALARSGCERRGCFGEARRTSASLPSSDSQGCACVKACRSWNPSSVVPEVR